MSSISYAVSLASHRFVDFDQPVPHAILFIPMFYNTPVIHVRPIITNKRNRSDLDPAVRVGSNTLYWAVFRFAKYWRAGTTGRSVALACLGMEDWYSRACIK